MSEKTDGGTKLVVDLRFVRGLSALYPLFIRITTASRSSLFVAADFRFDAYLFTDMPCMKRVYGDT